MTVETPTSDPRAEDFLRSDWRALLAASRYPDCSDYSSQFAAKMQECEQAGDSQQAALYRLLMHVTSMQLNFQKPSEPFGPMFVFNTGRSATLSDFTDAELAFFAGILPRVDVPELEARLADVLWLRKRDHQAARTAVAAYLKAAGLLADASWVYSEPRIERAFDLSVEIGHQDSSDAVVAYIEALLVPFFGTVERSFFPVRLMKLLLRRQAGDFARYAQLAELLAGRAEADNDWHQARDYWNIASEWHRLNKNDEQKKATLLRSAETFVGEAQAATKRPSGPSNLVAAHFLESAIQALRKVGGQKERIAEIHTQLLEIQEKGVGEMATFSQEWDAQEIIEVSERAVSGKTLFDALFQLCLLLSPPKVSHLREQAQQQRKDFILSQFFPKVLMNGMGRVVARQSGSKSDSNEEALRVDMFHNAQQGRTVSVQGGIEPARNRINQEHAMRLEDFWNIAESSSFVPQGRERLFAKGLFEGMQGEFMTATHLLVPQIENALRQLLEQQGILTSGVDQEGIQEEYDLNRMLREPQFAEPLTKVLGGDTVFDLRGLLVERFGSNLRNDMAHGLLQDGAFYSVSCVYLWWLTLRLCCLPVIGALQQSQKAAELKSNLPEPSNPPHSTQESSPSDELDSMVQRLMEAGLLTSLPTAALGPPPPPIQVSGTPVSQTILEERI